MKHSKLLGWAAVILLVLWIGHSPKSAANVFRRVGAGIGSFAVSAGVFMDNVTR